MIWPILEARAEIQKYFRSFFGSNEDIQKSFWNYLTFSLVKSGSIWKSIYLFIYSFRLRTLDCTHVPASDDFELEFPELSRAEPSWAGAFQFSSWNWAGIFFMHSFSSSIYVNFFLAFMYQFLKQKISHF